MKILRIEAEGFRGLPDGAYLLGGGDTAAQLTMVSGPPRCGATSLLDAIAAAKELVGGYGPLPAVEQLLRRGVRGGRLEVEWLLNEAEQRAAGTERARWTTGFGLRPGAPYELADAGLRRVFSTHPCRGERGCGGLEYFDARRELPVTSRRVLDEESELAWRARRGPDRYAGLLPWLERTLLRDGIDALDALDRGGVVARWDRADALSDVRVRIHRLLPALHLERIDLRSTGAALVFATADGGVRELADLSDGERARLLFALAFRRYRLDHSVVLVDDVDLCGPREAREELLLGLSELGRDTQLIVTTRGQGPRPRSAHTITLGASG